MVTLAERALRLDVANYHRLRLDTERPTELIDGRVVEMNPIGAAHLTVVSRLQDRLVPALERGRVKVQQPLRIPDFDEPQPDLAVLTRPLDLRIPEPGDVELVIEVSDSTLAGDRRDKLPRYLAAGLQVWIVNIHNHAMPQLEVYTGAAAAPARVHHGGAVPLEAEVSVDLDALFAGLAGLPYDEPSDDDAPPASNP
jgi:Uma2 family endonuclease